MTSKKSTSQLILSLSCAGLNITVQMSNISINVIHWFFPVPFKVRTMRKEYVWLCEKANKALDYDLYHICQTQLKFFTYCLCYIIYQYICYIVCPPTIIKKMANIAITKDEPIHLYSLNYRSFNILM